MTEPIAYTTTRHRCPHCNRSYANRSYARKHVLRCADIQAEPGPEVTAMRDKFGQVFDRIGDVWVDTTFVDDVRVPDLELSWKTLVVYHGPLTDASGGA